MVSVVALTTPAETNNVPNRSLNEFDDPAREYKTSFDQRITRMNKKDWDAAIHNFSKAISVDPTKPSPYE